MPLSRIAASTVALALLGLLGYWLSRPSYPPVSSAAYQCATPLYTICNQRASQRLPQIVEVVEQTHAREALPSSERDWLLAIIETADAGDWQAAAAECRELLECQVTEDPVTEGPVTEGPVTEGPVTEDIPSASGSVLPGAAGEALASRAGRRGVYTKS